jgi:phosphoribosylamine---glycine ligase
MNIAVIGSGGREHTIVWKLHQSPLVKSLVAIPGNPGTASCAENIAVNPDNTDALLDILRQYKIDLVVIGPEVPLVNGLADTVRSTGIRCFGPGKEAAMIEGSKSFAKNFMKRHNIPTAEYKVFSQSELYDAIRYLSEVPMPVVIKASGLAAGKGVVMCDDKDEAEQVARGMLSGRTFKDAGTTIIIEEFLIGEEVSIFALSDGERFALLAPAQDHKKLLDGDKGKNTGGMGAYAPAPAGDEKLMTIAAERIIEPTIRGLKVEGKPFIGCLYAGLIITPSGPKVLEYNCRFGDPETQVVLPLIDADLADILYQAAGGMLTNTTIPMHNASAVCVVMVSGGYPDIYETGKEIQGIEKVREDSGVVVFQAGTKTEKNRLVTAGGRVLGITALGYRDDLAGTVTAAYSAVEKITFDGAYYRSDIGAKALNR